MEHELNSVLIELIKEKYPQTEEKNVSISNIPIEFEPYETIGKNIVQNIKINKTKLKNLDKIVSNIRRE